MKRIEIYINSKGNLTIDLFKRYEDEYAYSTYKGNDAYELIQKLTSNRLNDVVENRIRDNVSLEYKNYIIILNEPNILLNRRGMGPLIKSINDFYERTSKEVVKNRKVSRKNKHTGTKIIAAGLAVLLIGTVASNNFKRDVAVDSSVKEKNAFVEQIENNIEYNDLNFVFENSDEQKEEDSIFIDYGDRSSEDKVRVTKAYYGGLIEKYAKQYGLDANLVLAIATQEKGIHSSKQDRGGATGLMQIQNSVWEKEYINAYNFETETMENIYVTKEKIGDLNNNIKFGCMYFQNCLEYMNYNVLAAVQCYNMGKGNMMKILTAYSLETNKTIEEVLKDKNDIGWLDYRDIPMEGDPEYIEHVFSWLGKDIQLSNLKKDNSINISKISNNMCYKKIY